MTGNFKQETIEGLDGLDARTRFLLKNPAFFGFWVRRYRVAREELEDLWQSLILASMEAPCEFSAAGCSIVTYSGQFVKWFLYRAFRRKRLQVPTVELGRFDYDDGERGDPLENLIGADDEALGAMERDDERRRGRDVLAWTFDNRCVLRGAWVYVALYLDGWKLAEVAALFGVSRAAVSEVLDRFTERARFLLGCGEPVPMGYGDIRFGEILSEAYRESERRLDAMSDVKRVRAV